MIISWLINDSSDDRREEEEERKETCGESNKAKEKKNKGSKSFSEALIVKPTFVAGLNNFASIGGTCTLCISLYFLQTVSIFKAIIKHARG